MLLNVKSPPAIKVDTTSTEKCFVGGMVVLQLAPVAPSGKFSVLLWTFACGICVDLPVPV